MALAIDTRGSPQCTQRKGHFIHQQRYRNDRSKKKQKRRGREGDAFYCLLSALPNDEHMKIVLYSFHRLSNGVGMRKSHWELIYF